MVHWNVADLDTLSKSASPPPFISVLLKLLTRSQDGKHFIFAKADELQTFPGDAFRGLIKKPEKLGVFALIKIEFPDIDTAQLQPLTAPETVQKIRHVLAKYHQLTTAELDALQKHYEQDVTSNPQHVLSSIMAPLQALITHNEHWCSFHRDAVGQLFFSAQIKTHYTKHDPIEPKPLPGTLSFTYQVTAEGFLLTHIEASNTLITALLINHPETPPLRIHPLDHVLTDAVLQWARHEETLQKLQTLVSSEHPLSQALHQALRQSKNFIEKTKELFKESVHTLKLPPDYLEKQFPHFFGKNLRISKKPARMQAIIASVYVDFLIQHHTRLDAIQPFKYALLNAIPGLQTQNTFDTKPYEAFADLWKTLHKAIGVKSLSDRLHIIQCILALEGLTDWHFIQQQLKRQWPNLIAYCSKEVWQALAALQCLIPEDVSENASLLTQLYPRLADSQATPGSAQSPAACANSVSTASPPAKTDETHNIQRIAKSLLFSDSPPPRPHPSPVSTPSPTRQGDDAFSMQRIATGFEETLSPHGTPPPAPRPSPVNAPSPMLQSPQTFNIQALTQGLIALIDYGKYSKHSDSRANLKRLLINGKLAVPNLVVFLTGQAGHKRTDDSLRVKLLTQLLLSENIKYVQGKNFLTQLYSWVRKRLLKNISYTQDPFHTLVDLRIKQDLIELARYFKGGKLYPDTDSRVQKATAYWETLQALIEKHISGPPQYQALAELPSLSDNLHASPLSMRRSASQNTIGTAPPSPAAAACTSAPPKADLFTSISRSGSSTSLSSISSLPQTPDTEESQRFLPIDPPVSATALSFASQLSAAGAEPSITPPPLTRDSTPTSADEPSLLSAPETPQRRPTRSLWQSPSQRQADTTHAPEPD